MTTIAELGRNNERVQLAYIRASRAAIPVFAELVDSVEKGSRAMQKAAIRWSQENKLMNKRQASAGRDPLGGGGCAVI